MEDDESFNNSGHHTNQVIDLSVDDQRYLEYFLVSFSKDMSVLPMNGAK